jgi:hypothetical protein
MEQNPEVKRMVQRSLFVRLAQKPLDLPIENNGVSAHCASLSCGLLCGHKNQRRGYADKRSGFSVSSEILLRCSPF